MTVDIEESTRAVDRRTASTASEQEAADALGLDDLVAVTDDLTPIQQSTLLLRVIGDLSVRQTADALDISESAVKTAQHRALQALRQRLDEPATKPSDPSVTEVT